MKRFFILMVFFAIAAGAGAQLKLAANSFVGVGTNNPYEQFQIGTLWTFHNGGTKFIGRNVRYAFSGGAWQDVRIHTGYASQIRFSENNIFLAIYESREAGTATVISDRYLVLHENGNVGIGTLPAKGYKLHVSGSIKGTVIQSAMGFEVISGSLSTGSLLRENIEKMKSPLSKLNLISAYSYLMKEETFPEDSMEITPERSQKVIGFLGEEVESAFPELVKAPDSISPYYRVNYTGMIPVLVEAIKEQQSQTENLQTALSGQELEMEILLKRIATMEYYIDELNERLEACCSSDPEFTPPSYNPPAPNPPDAGNSTTTGSAMLPKQVNNETFDESIAGAKLFQNVPNPFSVNTEIKFEIPDYSISAQILIHDMQGTEIKSYAITANGVGNIIIQGSELPAGMYMYTLLVNNTVIDTKKMILTK